MEISKDYRDLFRIFNKYKVKYMVVGAYAMIYYTEPRFTKDIDIWIKNDMVNAKKAYKALGEFGAPLEDISVEDFTRENLIYQIGVAPVRIDIMMSLIGMKFENAWKNREKTRYDNISVNIIGLKDLIRSKKNSGRKQDGVDLESLLRLKR